MRRSGSIRLGILLAVSALLGGCGGEKRTERRCVDDDGRFVDDGLCDRTPDGSSAASGGWDEPGPQAPAHRSGYHVIWIPYGTYGGPGSYAAGFQRPVPGAAPGAAAASSTSPSSGTSRGGFGATGAAKGGGSSAAHAGS